MKNVTYDCVRMDVYCLAKLLEILLGLVRILSFSEFHHKISYLAPYLIGWFGFAVVLFEVEPDDILLIHGYLSVHDPSVVLVLILIDLVVIIFIGRVLLVMLLLIMRVPFSLQPTQQLLQGTLPCASFLHCVLLFATFI